MLKDFCARVQCVAQCVNLCDDITLRSLTTCVVDNLQTDAVPALSSIYALSENKIFKTQESFARRRKRVSASSNTR